jgi:hypothetical protein
MKKSEVYSWRVDPEMKAALEDEARRDRQSLGALLARIAADWLARRRSLDTDDAQARLHRAAARTFGRLAGGDPGRSAAVRATVRRRLIERRGR